MSQFIVDVCDELAHTPSHTPSLISNRTQEGGVATEERMMSATARKYEHALKRIAKIAWEAQEIEDLSPNELGELEVLINLAMEASGTELPLSEFVKGVIA